MNFVSPLPTHAALIMELFTFFLAIINLWGIFYIILLFLWSIYYIYHVISLPNCYMRSRGPQICHCSEINVCNSSPHVHSLMDNIEIIALSKFNIEIIELKFLWHNHSGNHRRFDFLFFLTQQLYISYRSLEIHFI